MKHAHSHLWPGVPLALLSAVLFGAAAPFAKLLLGVMPPQLLAGLLYLGAGLGLAAVQGGRMALGLRTPEAPLRRHDLPWLAAVVLFGGLAGPLLLMLGLTRTPAASGSLLLNLEGLATLLIAWVVFRENVDRRLMLGAFSILVGAAVLSWGGEGVRLDAGAALIAAACLAWGIDNNLTRKLSSADPVATATIKGLVAGSVNVGLALVLGAPVPSATTIGSAAVVGFLGVGVSLVLFMLALRHLGAARTGAYFSLAPFISKFSSTFCLYGRFLSSCFSLLFSTFSFLNSITCCISLLAFFSSPLATTARFCRYVALFCGLVIAACDLKGRSAASLRGTRKGLKTRVCRSIGR